MKKHKKLEEINKWVEKYEGVPAQDVIKKLDWHILWLKMRSDHILYVDKNSKTIVFNLNQADQVSKNKTYIYNHQLYHALVEESCSFPIKMLKGVDKSIEYADIFAYKRDKNSIPELTRKTIDKIDFSTYTQHKS